MTTEWRAILTYPHPENLDDDALETLVRAVPGYGVIDANASTHTMRVEMTIEAATLRQATEAALKAARTAHTDAFGHPGEPTHLRVLDVDEHLRESTNPTPLDLVGLVEVADIIGRTKQRAGQLAQQPDFPAPVAELRSGPVWTRASIEHWFEHWHPQTGRPRRT